MTETEYQNLKAKVLRELPIRQRLFTLAGDSWKPGAEETIADLFLAVARRRPEGLGAALAQLTLLEQEP